MTSPSAGRSFARWRAPGRVNLIGEHTDYNDGFALPFAIPSGVTATVRSGADGILRIRSAQEPDRVELPLDRLAPGSLTGWAAYPAGVVWAFLELLEGSERPGRMAGPGRPGGPGRRGRLGRPGRLGRLGLDIAIDGDVPLGAGLSSSAAVVCSTAAAIDEVLGLGLSRPELVDLSRQAENGFVGAPTGGMDQTASLLCQAGHALLIDTRAKTTEQVPLDPAPAGLALLVTDSRVRHAHAVGGYAARRDACMRAAATVGVAALRDIDDGDLPGALAPLAGDDEALRCARHVITEDGRVLRVAQRLRHGAIEEIGPLLDESHESLRTDFAVSTPEVDLAVETARAAGGLGSRITGGGWGGCTITLARADDVSRIEAAVAGAYAGRGYVAPRFWTVTPSPGATCVPAV